jgi:hypothetical protein
VRGDALLDRGSLGSAADEQRAEFVDLALVSLVSDASAARESTSGRSCSNARDQTQHLRVLIANEKRDRLELLANVVIGLGHDVIAREIYVKEVGTVTARERPDVALVGLGESSAHALELISEIVREASLRTT